MSDWDVQRTRKEASAAAGTSPTEEYPKVAAMLYVGATIEHLAERIDALIDAVEKAVAR